ncbi:MAG: hypothetical protein G3M70_09310 [Candidatus Nitronauta litoralis]|uniref:Uncharacterized protein n=1 Tax=Candidatus Nitronauta litoralis TaxID=2705533 RepID=A0A7T0G0P5_9BACT|nr:MAG: hypothetical protein G3M70_09310 [Candidatus Nitronauta litoralis]
MPSSRTLKSLAETLIEESSAPFSTEEYLERVKDNWRRRIAPSTLEGLKQNLQDHHLLIETPEGGYLPYRLVLERIGHVPLLIKFSAMEWQRQVFIPGHQVIPFLSGELSEEDPVFHDVGGREMKKKRESFYIEEVLTHFEYAGETHFPDRIRINERLPGKSKIDLTVWDLSSLIESGALKSGDALKVTLQDYHTGRFQFEIYPKEELRRDRLRLRAFHVALENTMKRQWEEGGSKPVGLEKQLLQSIFALDKDQLNPPAFSLTELVESLNHLSVYRGADRGLHFAPLEASLPDEIMWEEAPRMPNGSTGSLDAIFQDMGLAFSEPEFKAILYALMGEDDFNVEAVFQLLFEGKKDNFHSKKQHNAFYRKLRVLLNAVCADLKTPEPKLVTQLRMRTTFIKLRLIEILRYFEEQEVTLPDLPETILDQLADLDTFCADALKKLADRPRPPDVKSIRDIRLGLKVMQPHLDRLEEDVYYRLGIY